MIVGLDESAKVVFTVGNDERISSYAEKGYKVVRLSKVPEILLLKEDVKTEKGVDRTKQYRPVVGGISVGNIAITAGTLGWVIEDEEGNKYILSNAHVLSDDPSKPTATTAVIVQPGTYDTGMIPVPTNEVAKYVWHKQIFLDEQSSNCPVAKFWVGMYNVFAKAFGRKTRLRAYVPVKNKVDVALAKLEVDSVDRILLDDGTYYKPTEFVGLLFAGSEKDGIMVACKMSNVLKELGKAFPDKAFMLGGYVADVKVGDKIKKCGRTTGCTEGEVIATSATIKVFYGKGFATFEDVIIAKLKTKGGDSGSLVYKV